MSWIESKISEIPEPVRDALGIDSPSKVMADVVGRPIVQGIQAGMQTEMPSLLRSAASMVGGLANVPVPALAGAGVGAGAAGAAGQAITFERGAFEGMIVDSAERAVELAYQVARIIKEKQSQ